MESQPENTQKRDEEFIAECHEIEEETVVVVRAASEAPPALEIGQEGVDETSGMKEERGIKKNTDKEGGDNHGISPRLIGDWSRFLSSIQN